MAYARRLWPAFETYHAHVYFVPEAAEAYRGLGLKGGWIWRGKRICASRSNGWSIQACA